MTTTTVFSQLDQVLAERRHGDPDTSYTAGLYAGGIEAILAKVVEENSELVDAARRSDNSHLVHEVADLWFHCMVLLQARGLNTAAVEDELGRRFGVSGIDEKAARDA